MSHLPEYQEGRVKWFRYDGTGYITSLENPYEPVLFDRSVIKSENSPKPSVETGTRVKFRSTMIMGRKVATDVQPI